MKRIAIDMDEVIVDLHKKHLNLFNEKYNESLTPEDLLVQEFGKSVPMMPMTSLLI
ncbi:hypothetical protein NQ095_12940 [Rossellomorea sp. SC111]|uniref:5' nucleotidase, NT5C type n=1 Tax=Rossellomorea sp. SC111 TaxID=2968985 RepID=UPI00215B0DDA|nr:hypothetical protein [Rossellomorea sp. SC111]MCR8849320.1 hypothetical protein [Rossellomorea sp. SC111]